MMNTLKHLTSGVAAAALVALTTVSAVAGNAHDIDTTELGKKKYTYEKGKIIQLQLQKSGKMKIWINRGKNRKVYVGSTGVLYRGGTKKFLKGSDGKTVRFRVTKVRDGECEAVIFQGKVSFDTVQSNRRVLLRRRP